MRSIFALPAQLAALLFAASSSHAFSFERAQPADLDISQLGRVGVAGDFDAVSLYEWVGQSQSSGAQNGGSSLLSRYPNGAFANLHESDGTIQATCPFVHQDGRLAGVILGGNFTSVGGVAANGVALFNATTGSIQPLPGLTGTVSALYCDTEGDRVWVGGSFSGGNSSNAISWVTGWTNLPFAGFNGPVNSITKLPNGNMVFGGNFDGLGNTTAPQVRDSQVVPVSSAEIVGIASTSQEGFSDPRNIVCKTGESDGPGNSWLLADNAAGAWDATFRFGFIPTKLRLYNTNQQGRGTKTWRFTAQPINGIMNFSYVDPNDGQTRYCDARCPLPEGNTTAQDFRFVNAVGMDKFRIDISEWYGAGAGLAGLVLFQDDVYSFAINDFNEAQCDGVSTGQAESTATGPWTVTPSHQSNSEYLTAQLEGPISGDSASVVFRPNIKQSGNYSITIFTPGCIGDGTCATRGRVNITGLMGSGSGTGPAQPVSTELWQTNNFDKYDEIYVGRIDIRSGNFQPAITLSPASGQTGPLTVVAQKIRSNLRVSTGGLNGLYEYNPNLATVQDDFSSSTINAAGIALDQSATINALAADGETVFVAGNFSSDTSAGVFSITDRANDLGEGGLNGAVAAVTLNNSALYMAGSFTGTRGGETTGLSGVASYNVSTSRWAALGAGVNGHAQFVVPIQLNLTNDEPELAIAFSGNFDRINAFGNNEEVTARGFAVWIPSANNWLNNINSTSVYLQGVLTAGGMVPGNPPVYAGQVQSFTLGTSGAFELADGGSDISQFPASIRPTPEQPAGNNAKVKRALVSNTTTGVVAGLFYRENNFNLTIYGGHFTSTATNGSTITNLVVVDGADDDTVTGFASGIDSDSVVAALGATESILFVGGSLSGNVNGRAVSGMIAYDLNTKDYASSQPASLQGPSSVTVNAIAPQPDTDLVYVGGDFESAGSFNCPALCVYDISRSQWVSPGGAALSGSVASMAWVSDSQLALAGNLTVGGNTSTVVIYDSTEDSGTFRTIDGPAGTLTAITSGSSDGSQYWVGGANADGEPLIQKYNGSWTPLEPGLGDGSVIQGLQVFSTSRDHGRADLLARNHVLMVLGSLNVPDFGDASAAIFNGTAWTPYALTGANTGSASLRSVFVENPANFFTSGRNYLALGFIVLIGLAISLGIIFLLVLLGLFVERYRRKRDGYVRAPQVIPQDKFTNMSRVPPEHLFGSMNPNNRPQL